MKWGDCIKRTAVRRVVWIVVGLIVYGVFGLLGLARAAVCGIPTVNEAGDAAGRNVVYEFEGEAAVACEGVPAEVIVYSTAGTAHVGGFVGCSAVSGNRFRASYSNQLTGGRRLSMSSCQEQPPVSNTYTGSTDGWRWGKAGCAGGLDWREDLKQCVTSCNAREPMLGNFRWTSSGSSYSPPCVDGCSYEEQGTGLCAGDYCVARGGLAPTGAQCSTGPTPSPLSSTPDGVCSPIGNRGAQHCVSSGDPPRHCIVHASGLSQCWDGTETGPRVNRSGTDGASREFQPATPAPHPNQQGAQPEGSSTAKAGGGTFNIVEFSGNGNSADAGDNGSAPGQGSAPGWGNTIGQGPGNSDGTGEGDDGDGPGTPAPGISDDLYERDERTIAQLYDDYRARVDNAPISQALDNVFSPPQGGSCPTFSLPASAYWEAMVFDFHCREPLSDILRMMGWVVLALAAYLAVRIAFE